MGGRRTAGEFCNRLLSGSEHKFLVEVFNTEAGDEKKGYERQNMGQSTWSGKNEREPARLSVEENLKQLHPQSRLAEPLPRHGKPD